MKHKSISRAAVSAMLVAVGAMSASITHAAPQSDGAELKVCADPDYLPYSNEAGQGFENEVAKLVGKKLDATVNFVWGDSRELSSTHGGYTEYLAQNLDSGRCDMVMSMPFGGGEELTTNPYYISAYVLVFKKSRGYDLSTLDSKQLQTLKIGFESDTPVEDGLQVRGLVTEAKSYDIGTSSNISPRSVLEDVENGTIDVMITWQPSIGAYLKDFPDLTTVALPNSRAHGSLEMYSFPMSMAVRKDDQALKDRLNALIKTNGDELRAILTRHGVEMTGDAAALANAMSQ